MKHTLKRMGRTGLALVLVACMVVGMSPMAFAAYNHVSDVNNDGVINYVSIGASNVNGYGMRGYLDEYVYDQPWLKDQVNIYGYQQQVEGSYPDQIADYLENKGYEVERNELAMSSMRAEEVRYLLDDSYTGDAYTDWRFIDVPGYDSRYSQNWFYLAGCLELGNPNAAPEEAVAALKQAYRDYIANADLITLDIGINNFGVYASNQIVSNLYENDMNVIDPELAAKYALGKAYVLELMAQEMGDVFALLPAETLDHMADTMAYALVGFCLSFDAIMAEIRELNPDATIAVVSIQNLMAGLNLSIAGIDEKLPFGEVFGALINAANVYTATISPYCTKYVYADVRQNGHVEFFMDEILAYNGDPTTLSQDMIDCFDVYDNDLYIKSRVQQLLASELKKAFPQYVQLTDAQANNLEAFAMGLATNSITVAGMTLQDYLAAGAAGRLAAIPTFGPTLAQYYAIYEKALYTAYDVIAEIMQAGVAVDTLDASSFGVKFGPVEDALLGGIFGTLETAVGAALQDPVNYSFSLEEVYPDGFFETLAAAYDLPIGLVNTVASMGIRTGIGNSFYGHPNMAGHTELKTAILNALRYDISGKRVVFRQSLRLANGFAGFLADHGSEIYAFAEAQGYPAQVKAALGAMILDTVSNAGLAMQEAAANAIRAGIQSAAQSAANAVTSGLQSAAAAVETGVKVAAVAGIAAIVIADRLLKNAPEIASAADELLLSGTLGLIDYVTNLFPPVGDNTGSRTYFIVGDSIDAANAAGTVLLGDVNSDGAVNELDAMLIQYWSVEIVDGPALNMGAGDMNADGVVDSIDAMLILQLAA